ncbi:MAG: glycosyltransferase family 2 protein [Flavobacteriaceae bacterium]
MKFAVVILNWNGKALLEKFLPSVMAYSEEAQVYVADNASTDDSVAFLERAYPQVKIIRNQANFGFAKGYNEALKKVSEPYWVLLNSDVEVTENWLKTPLQLFENEPETAALQPKILDYKNKNYFEYAGAAGGFIDKYGFPFCRGRIFSTLEKDLGQYDQIEEIFWASGACLFIRKSVFEALEGFDSDYFAHQEEIDLCWRIQNENLKIKYVPDSVVYHIGGATLKENSPKKTFLNFRNSLFSLLKNHPKKGLFSTFFIRLCTDGIAGVFFLLQGKPRHVWAVVQSHFAVYAQLKKTLSKRKNNQKPDYFHTKSIVFDYFVKKRKYF